MELLEQELKQVPWSSANSLTQPPLTTERGHSRVELNHSQLLGEGKGRVNI